MADPNSDPNEATRSLAPAQVGATLSAVDQVAAAHSEAAPARNAIPAVTADRYTLGEEIARGGMGVVYRATDTVLGREVAVKVLQEKFGPNSGAARRFADEARITGQLQHPNIPAVHDLGVLPDGRPFLAMKLIKGETLDTQLVARTGPDQDRGRFVAVFEQVCQAVAYAHAHDVIHRDLKPANVMVGSYGEVQVMDWGLAKVLSGGVQPGADGPIETAAATDIRSLRESDGEYTQAGSVLGTPAFMPPEQAVGAVGKIDARSDVFGLGAILAVILTGKPPFAASSAETTRVKAAQGDLADCFAQLDACGADAELVQLCKRCLSPKKDDRPVDASAVALAVAAFRLGAEERAKVAELERARAEVQAREQHKRRRTVLIAASALVLVLGLGVVGTTIGFVRVAHQRRAVVQQRDEIADREKQVVAQKKIADDRLKVYQKAVDGFVNEAPSIVEGHPLGSTVVHDLLELSGQLLRDVQATGVDDSGLGKRGEMSAIIRQAHLARQRGRTDDAAKLYDDAFKMGEELLRTTSPEEKGKNTGNLALLIGRRTMILRIRAETRAGMGEKAKARATFAEAVKLHDEAIAMGRRVVDEPDMRDIPVGEAKCWLAGSYLDLADTRRLSAVASDDAAGRRAAHDAARAAATQAEELFAAGLAAGGFERALHRMRMRHAIASWERAKAADKLDRDAEADAAYQRGFELFDQLVKDTPRNLLHRIEFAKLAADQGYFLMMKVQDAKRAQEACRVAVEQYRRVARPLELTHYHSEMGGNLYRQGVAASVLGDAAKAKELFRHCVEVWEEQLREAIRMSSPTSAYTVSPRIRLMFAQARAGDHAAAAGYAAVLRKDYDKTPDKLNYAAQGFALASAATNDPALAAAYRDKAFETLARAAEVGLDSVSQVERDPDYDALRGDPRFAPLAAKVRENASRKR